MKTNIYLYGLMIFLAAAIFSSIAIAQDEVKKEGWFYADDNPYVEVALRDSEFATGVLDALADAGTNWTSLWDGIESFTGDQREDACWMVVNMPHLDRLEMTKDTLVEHVSYAYKTKTDLPYSIPEDMFREYILTYRMGDEPVRPYRKLIWDEFSNLISDTPADTAKAINQWVFENMTSRERGFFGPRPDPWSVITARTGTEADIAGVAIAMCKTFGIPARRAMIGVLGEESGGKTWLEIYSDGAWLPLYPDSPDNFGNTGFIEIDHPHNVTVVSAASAFTQAQVTSRYTDTGTVHFLFTQNGESVDDFENFCVSAWNDGAWLPLDDLWYDPEDLGLNSDETPGFTAILGDGFYIAQVGVRNPRGDAYVQTKPVMVNSGDAIELEFNLDIPASESSPLELVLRTLDPLPVIDLDYSGESPAAFNFPADLSTSILTCVVIFDPASEPSIRMLPMISEWCASHNSTLLGIGIGDLTACQTLWSESTASSNSSAPIFHDPDGTIASAFGQTPDEQGQYTRLPMVLLMTPDHKIIYLKDGFDLSVADGLSRAVELS
jgi:transglutaminase-like putative cysteine protease